MRMTSNKEAAIDVDSNTSISDSHTPLSDCQIDVNVIDIPTRNTFDSEPSRASTANNETTLSNQDAMLYDRQIRLWGIEAQQKLMNSRVLFLGKNGIQEEAIKNLILAGMSITLANDLNVTEEDVQHSFFLRGSDAGKNHAEALVHRMHEMVSDKRKVTSINSAIIKDLNKDDMQKFHTDDFPLTDYDVVSCAMETYLLPKVLYLNELCRSKNIAFFASMGNGTQGFFFQDLINHTVLERMSKASGSVTINYRSFQNALEEPRLPNRCDIAIKTTLAYLLIKKAHPELVKDGSRITCFTGQLEDICNTVGAQTEEVLFLFKNEGKRSAITSGILGGYIALEIRKFVTKQHETIPSLCVFDMARSTVVTAMI